MKTSSLGITYYSHENGISCTVNGIGTFCDPVLIIPRTLDGYTVTKIGAFAFSRNSFLKKVVLPDTLETIGMSAFFACSALQEVIVPDRLKILDYCAFQDCSMISEITIGSGMTEIRSLALKGIRSIRVSENNRCYRSENGNLYTKDGKTLVQYAMKKDDLSFSVPDGVTTLGNGAFADCAHLTEIKIPDSLRAILWSVFQNCTGLRRMVLPEKFAHLGGGAFHGCRALEEISLGTGLQCIETEAFKDCPSLSFIRYSGTAEQWHAIKIEEDWNDESPQIRVETRNADKQRRQTQNDASPYLQYTVNDDGKTCTVCGIGLCLDTEIVIPTAIDGYTVTAIGEAAFKQQSRLVSLTVPDGVSELGYELFCGCTHLERVEITNGLPEISEYMFDGCLRLRTVSIARGVEHIPRGAFRGCESLTEITVPSSVITISDFAFGNCTALTSIRYEGTEKQWAEMCRGDHWKKGSSVKTVLFV